MLVENFCQLDCVTSIQWNVRFEFLFLIKKYVYEESSSQGIWEVNCISKNCTVTHFCLFSIHPVYFFGTRIFYKN